MHAGAAGDGDDVHSSVAVVSLLPLLLPMVLVVLAIAVQRFFLREKKNSK